MSALGVPAAASIGAVVGVAEGALVLALATPGRYRRSEERGLPIRRRAWVPLWTTVVCTLIAVSWRSTPGFLSVLLVSVVAMVAACVVDVDVHRLPNMLTLPLLAVLLVLLGVLAATTGRWWALGRAVLAAAVVFLVFLLLGLVGRGGMGMGDVKLSASIGLLAGYLSWVHVILAVLAAALIGTAWGLVLRVARGRDASRDFAFGPHLVAGLHLVLCLPVLTAVWS